MESIQFAKVISASFLEGNEGVFSLCNQRLSCGLCVWAWSQDISLNNWTLFFLFWLLPFKVLKQRGFVGCLGSLFEPSPSLPPSLPSFIISTNIYDVPTMFKPFSRLYWIKPTQSLAWGILYLDKERDST